MMIKSSVLFLILFASMANAYEIAYFKYESLNVTFNCTEKQIPFEGGCYDCDLSNGYFDEEKLACVQCSEGTVFNGTDCQPNIINLEKTSSYKSLFGLVIILILVFLFFPKHDSQ